LLNRFIQISVGFDNLFRVFCDVAATIALSWNLAQAQRQSRVKKYVSKNFLFLKRLVFNSLYSTVTMLQKLVAFIVARGLLVTVITFAFGVMYLVHPDNLYWCA
jgi:hypothetical protein